MHSKTRRSREIACDVHASCEFFLCAVVSGAAVGRLGWRWGVNPVLTPVHNLRNHLVNDRRVIQLDASTQTDSNDASSSSALNETLTSVALDFVSSNSPAVLIANSMLHQAAKTVQRSIRRFIGSSDTARQRAVATFQQKEDALFNIYLARLRAIQLMSMHSRDAIGDFAGPITCGN